MKKLCYSICLMVVSALFVVSCSDGTIGDTFAEDNYAPSGGTIVNYGNIVNGFFDIASPAAASVGFDLTDFTGPEPSAVSLWGSFRGVTANLGELGASFPSSHTVTLTDLASALNFDVSTVEVGETASLFFDAVNSSGTFRSQNALVVPFSCFSGLAGTHDYVSTGFYANSPYAGPCPASATGQVTFTEQSSGVYLVSDLGFGQYESTCWSDGPATSANATISDVCNQLSSGGLDQYQLVYTWVITDVSGPELSITWSNDYGDGGDVVITKEGGADWPPLFN
jgi:hypothetical protein